MWFGLRWTSHLHTRLAAFAVADRFTRWSVVIISKALVPMRKGCLRKLAGGESPKRKRSLGNALAKSNIRRSRPRCDGAVLPSSFCTVGYTLGDRYLVDPASGDMLR